MSPGTLLAARGVDVRRGDKAVVTGANLELSSGQVVALLGPNGAGKTSLLQAAMGLVPLAGGALHLGGTPTEALSARERALRVAYLPQLRTLAWPARVRDVVALGRFAYGVAFGSSLSAEDDKAIDDALAAADLTHLADRRADALSGGEAARMHCARAFASDAPLLLADEPTAGLDPRHQLTTFELLRDYAAAGRSVLVVLHDVNLAARFADRLVWMHQGRLVADGPVAQTLTVAEVERVYGVRARLVEDPQSPVPLVLMDTSV